MITVYSDPDGDPETAIVQASYNGFSGNAVLRYVGLRAIAKFADDIAGVPRTIPDQRHAELVGIDRNRFSLALGSRDSLGHGGASIVIWEPGDPPPFAVAPSMPTIAARIDTFVAQLRDVCSLGSGEASLRADDSAGEDLVMEKLLFSGQLDWKRRLTGDLRLHLHDDAS